MFNLSVVTIIADEHRVAVNQVAALYGCGENNLSVKLQSPVGTYWGLSFLVEAKRLCSIQ